ncbi:low molecular weight phosphotyrosine protein phosphatase 1-like isoform X1 [Apostichopus japonicus]|uniref:low molecular weight phosphotyrosine protein phosphatase 1-like isoform X1 n=1 Tax=Stichopus japonicus TaxID=307972 RepID=UPI003AB410AE
MHINVADPNILLYVGNICRSVMAESILKHMVAEKGQEKEWIIDSAATSDYEIGSTPDSRTNMTLKGNNLPESDHIARQIKKKDFDKFHYIFGFDDSNMNKLQRMKPEGSSVVVKKFGSYGAESKDDTVIEDPYYSSSMDAFDKVYEQCLRSCKVFLENF